MIPQLIVPIVAVVVFSAGTPLLGYQILRRMGRLPHPDAASISVHYGSVSVVTFAVGTSFLTRQAIPYEGYLSVFLEFPAIIIGVLLAKEVLAGKGFLSLFLLGMGLMTASRLAELCKVGLFLVAFGVIVPVLSAAGGGIVGWMLTRHLVALRCWPFCTAARPTSPHLQPCASPFPRPIRRYRWARRWA